MPFRTCSATSEWSFVNCCKAPPRSRYARLSPTCAMLSFDPSIHAAVSVAPMPRRSVFCFADSNISRFARYTALESRFVRSLQCRRGIGFRLDAMPHHGFHRHRARYFSMRLAAHSIGEHVQLERLHNLEAIFVVGADPPDISQAAARDTHTLPLSAFRSWGHPGHPGHSVLPFHPSKASFAATAHESK